MRFRRLNGWCVLFCGCWTVCALGQSAVKPARQNVHPPVTHSKAIAGPRLLDAEEGLAILGAALETRSPAHRAESRSDCSHLVNTIYERAGFPYTYASSSDLYMGTDDFRRVAQPQAGDLIVWRGHAGIVVSPRQHTFFSALRSGFGVQPYDSAYWLGRGHPHFLRYVRQNPASVLAASNKPVSLQPAAMHIAPVTQNVPFITVSGPWDEEFEDGSVPYGQAPLARSIPRTVVVASPHPSPEQVRAALLAAFRDTADALQAQDVFQLSSPLICFDEFEVGKIQRKGDGGWVEMHLVAPDPITGKPSRGRKIADRQHWGLHRSDAETWELSLPGDAVYLPRALAVRVLSHQLATLSERDSNANGDHDKQAQLARWLDALLEDVHTR